MALFSRLLNLNTGSIPLEDFFTELVAYLFSTDKEILYAWLKDLNLLDINACLHAYVSTQREFEPLDGHRLASRPDILIELVDIKRFFLQALDELEKIKDQYSKLPWGASQDNEESPDDVLPAT